MVSKVVFFKYLKKIRMKRCGQNLLLPWKYDISSVMRNCIFTA